MDTASNELIGQPFVYTSQTPNVPMVLPIPRDTQVAGWRLKSLLLVQTKPARKGWVATGWLEGIAEYGTAENETDAITDLVVSLGEYKEALEKREEGLGDSARRELDYLRKLIERSSEIDAERQKLELDITQEFEFADGEATLLIDETK